ncbi:lactate utilization protein B [Acidiphilium sp.]|uniref:lactate utilization protein B n=1 Tax=Acidiphilium sp. TaxID=527 RepID=UPI003CFF8B04
MRHDPRAFVANAREAIADERLHGAIVRTTGNAERKRSAAVANFTQFEAARDRGVAIRDHVLANLAGYLAEFERNATDAGAIVHYAQTADEACQIVLDICRTERAQRVTRVKSMLGEEIGIPHALDAAGIERIETDLAEHIIQLAGDPPSHIVWPALHRTRAEIADLFRRYHHEAQANDEVITLVQSARHELRQKFLSADIAISGANFLVADSGAICTVTNEGNAELSITPARVHIVTAGIEKLVPSMGHAMALLRLLVRSATGAEITQYTSFYRGGRRTPDADGPQTMHIVLVDNGRTRMRSDGLVDMLRCIRCGACMNHCVVYQHIGGHAYGGVYPGPMGAVITPALDGIAASRDLVQACTLNGKCQEVCPVRIPLPSLLRLWRNRSWREGLEPQAVRAGLGVWAFAANRPWLYHALITLALPVIRRYGKQGWITAMPLAGGWTASRDLPMPARRSFMRQYKTRHPSAGTSTQ